MSELNGHIGDKVKVFGQLPSHEARLLDKLLAMYSGKFNYSVRRDLILTIDELIERGYNTIRYETDMDYLDRKYQKQMYSDIFEATYEKVIKNEMQSV